MTKFIISSEEFSVYEGSEKLFTCYVSGGFLYRIDFNSCGDVISIYHFKYISAMLKDICRCYDLPYCSVTLFRSWYKSLFV